MSDDWLASQLKKAFGGNAMKIIFFDFVVSDKWVPTGNLYSHSVKQNLIFGNRGLTSQSDFHSWSIVILDNGIFERLSASLSTELHSASAVKLYFRCHDLQYRVFFAQQKQPAQLMMMDLAVFDDQEFWFMCQNAHCCKRLASADFTPINHHFGQLTLCH